MKHKILLMPVMDGYAFLRHWKADEKLCKIPFVVYTATYTDPRDEKLALDLGADAFISAYSEPGKGANIAISRNSRRINRRSIILSGDC
jgi:response regulator RpfG family c-di-GMP phosphodiesterase